MSDERQRAAHDWMPYIDGLRARIAELEAQVAEIDAARMDRIGRELVARIAELEGERDYHRTAHDSAVQRIAELTKRNTALEAECQRLTAQVRPFSDALAERVIAAQVAEIDRLTAKLARLTATQLEREAHMDCYQYGVVP